MPKKKDQKQRTGWYLIFVESATSKVVKIYEYFVTVPKPADEVGMLVINHQFEIGSRYPDCDYFGVQADSFQSLRTEFSDLNIPPLFLITDINLDSKRR